MRQELRETTMYNTIIEAIALGNTKLNDINNKTSIDKSKLSVYIKNLISLGIIEREFSVSTKLKEQAASQRGLYRRTDNFFSVWYAFVFGNVSDLEAGDVGGVFKYSVGPALNQFASLKFEDICRQYLRRRNIVETLPFRIDKMGRYFEGDVEIDIVAFSKDKKNLLLGECKFKNTPFDLREFKSLTEKPMNVAGKAHYFLFSKSGFTDELTRTTNGENVHLIPMDALFSGEVSA
jgi:AAA+ ATPase superfamily predicted ATPase